MYPLLANCFMCSSHYANWFFGNTSDKLACISLIPSKLGLGKELPSSSSSWFFHDRWKIPRTSLRPMWRCVSPPSAPDAPSVSSWQRPGAIRYWYSSHAPRWLYKDQAQPQQGVEEGLPQQPSVSDLPHCRDARVVRQGKAHRVPKEGRVRHLPQYAISERDCRYLWGLWVKVWLEELSRGKEIFLANTTM